MSRGAILRAAPLLLIAAALASAADHSSSLEGTIFNAASGEPLRKAVVTLRPDNQGQPFAGATVVIAPEKGHPWWSRRSRRAGSLLAASRPATTAYGPSMKSRTGMGRSRIHEAV